jgi:DNA segregation ATPase FtsK/SpoIIIE, S-DNA-T family
MTDVQDAPPTTAVRAEVPEASPATAPERRHRVRQVVTHPASRALARHAVHVALGISVAARRSRDARSTTRHERMMRAAETAGDHERALEWEDRARKQRQERHRRRMDLIRHAPHAAKATVTAAGLTVAGLFALGVLLALASHQPREAFGPLHALIETIRWCATAFDTALAIAVWAAPAGILLWLWDAGRRHAATSTTDWVVKLQPQAADAGTIVTADAVVRALQHLGITKLNAAFKGGWVPAFPLPPVREGRGYRFIVELPLGVNPSMVADVNETLARNLLRSTIEVWPTDAAKAKTGPVGCLDVWVADRGSLDKAAPTYPLLHEGTADVFAGVPVGVTPRGEILMAPVYAANAVAGGQMGQGKSNACRVYMLGCALDPLAELWVHVFANNGDFDAFEPRVARYHRGATDDVTAAGLQSLVDLYAEVERREDRLRVLGAKKLTRKIAAEHADLRPIVALFSECHELFGHPEFGEQAVEMGANTIRRARKTGITLMFDTQSARKEAIPPKIVELVSVNACFYVKSWRSNDGFLGDGSFAAGIRATELRPGTDRGTSLITGVSDQMFEILRWFFIEVNDDTGFDAATDVIARAMDLVADGTRTAATARPAKAPTPRDLLADLAEVLGDEPVPVAEAAKRLQVLDPTYPAYRGLTGADLKSRLADEHGVIVPKTGNRFPLDPGVVRTAMARREPVDVS